MKRHALIVVCSTSGNGDAPENASRFVRHIKKPPPQSSSSSHSTLPLENVAYAVLGLGDTNYDKFCEAGKVIDKKLQEWGAKRSMVLTCADEATGLEETVEPWLDNVLIKLETTCTAKNDDHNDSLVKDSDAATVASEMKEKLVVSSSETTTSSTPKEHVSSNDQSTNSSTSDGNTVQSNITTKNIFTAIPPIKSPTPLYILYGSATGNSEHIAKNLCSTYESYLKNPSFMGYFPSVVCCELNQFKKKCLDAWSIPPDPNTTKIKHGILIICSTTGNANAPENADRFLRWLKREPTMAFQHCAYAILGLGDSNYDVFCAIGKVIDKRLCELGGYRAVKVALADEATGLEEVVDPWVGSVIGKLANACRGQNELAVNSVLFPASESPQRIAKTSREAVSKAPPMAVEEQIGSSTEEKKMESIDERIAPITSSSITNDRGPSMGVQVIRKLLSLFPDDPLPTIPNSSLPSVITSLSSCELIQEEDVASNRRSRGGSIADNMTVSSASSGYLYTFHSPYESSILDARYLTETDVECATMVAKEVLAPLQATASAWCEDQVLMKVMKLYDEYFPISESTMTSLAITTRDVLNDQQLRYEKNGKRVIEMVSYWENFLFHHFSRYPYIILLLHFGQILSLPDDFTLEYEPGDSIGLIVPNSPQSVQFILAMLERHHGILPSQKISIDAAHPTTVEQVVRCKIDLCSPIKKKQLYLLSMHATDMQEERALRLLSSANGKEGCVNLFQRYIEDQHRTIVDILREFPSSQSITLEGLLGCLPSIPPRYYSICSSPLLDRQSGMNDKNNFHLKVAFSVVDYLTPSIPEVSNSQRRIGGLATRRLECACSPYLSNPSHAAANTSFVMSNLPVVHIFPKPTHDFRLPPNMSTPLILIGPGTGIAPFIGFLSHRQAQLALLESIEAAEVVSEGTWRGGYELERDDLAVSKGDTRGLNLAVDYRRNYQQSGDIDLFFGCRHSDHDFLYKKELEEFKSHGILTNLFVAFSRDGGKKEEKTYVQTLMQNDIHCGKRVVSMIVDKSASVYVCGDGNAMGKDIQETIVSLLAHSFVEKCTDFCQATDEAIAYVDQMKKSGRFVLDIWS